MVLQGTETIFETDIFAYGIETIEGFTDTHYLDHLQSYRILLDHLRSATFLICDGVVPSNEGRGYVLRRLIRRGYFNLTKLSNLDTTKLAQLFNQFVTGVIDDFAPSYEGMAGKADFVVDTLAKECQQFQQTISNGLNELEKLIKK